MVLVNIHSEILISSDGKIYEGAWENGLKHGKGKQFDPVSQKWTSGEWKKDVLIG